jgi:hypothetical protein
MEVDSVTIVSNKEKPGKARGKFFFFEIGELKCHETV